MIEEVPLSKPPDWLASAARRVSRIRRARRTVLALPNRPGSLKFAAIGDNGTGDRPAVRGRAADGQLARDVSLRSRHHARRQHVRRPEAGRLRQEIRAAVRGAARGRREVPGLARQPRSAGAGLLQALQHERPALLHVRAQQRPVLRARQHADGSEAARLDRDDAAETRARTGRSATSITRCTRMPSRHGSSVDLRVLLEPIFVKYGVNVVFSGHDHVYERLKPQKGIYYFVSGSAGQLRKGNMSPIGPDRRVLRPGPELHAGGGRRGGHVLPDRSRAPARRSTPA